MDDKLMQIKTPDKFMAAFLFLKANYIGTEIDDLKKIVLLVFESKTDVRNDFNARNTESLVFASDLYGHFRNTEKIIWDARKQKKWNGKK